MESLQWINAIIIALGVPTIIGGLIYVGKKLHLLEDIEESLVKIKHNMKVVGDYLTRHHLKFDPKELQALSPLTLTEAGKSLINEIGFDNVFEKNKADFFEFIDTENPKLKYDVEIAAIKSIYALYDKEYLNFLKVYLYNNPTRLLENIAPTLGIYVRDAYLAEHPEITE